MRLLEVMVEAMKRLWTRQSRQKSKKLKSLQSCKGHRFEQTFTNVPIFCRKTRASVRTLTVFQSFFAGPRSSLNTIFESVTNKAKQVKLLTFFPNRKKIFELNTRIFYQLWLTSFYTKFLSTRRTSSLRSILEMCSRRKHSSPEST